jgi:hypothetical protein
MQEREEVIRSRGGGLAMLQNGDQEFFERLLARFRVFQQANPVSPKEELKYFYYWLLKHSKAVVPIELYHKEMARLRVERDGDRQLLVYVGEVEKGRRDLTFSVGSERGIVGSGVVRWNALPRYAGKGDYLLLTISRPRCRVCGCTRERPCPGGCSLIEPDLCSKHPQRMSRRRGQP